MQPKAYLFFNGQANDALQAYSKIFKTQPSALMRMSDAPPEMGIPADRKDWIMHCELPVGGGAIYMSDDFAANSPPMDGCSVMLNYDTAAEARPVFDALAENGEIRMPWEPTFWSAGFGTLTDAFGIRWMVGCNEPPAG